jgi:uncharacterized membrane-anchored protein
MIDLINFTVAELEQLLARERSAVEYLRAVINSGEYPAEIESLLAEKLKNIEKIEELLAKNLENGKNEGKNKSV